MENKVFAKVGAFFGKEIIQHFSFLIIGTLALTGCASSDVSRDAAANIDLGVNNAKKLVEGTSDQSLGDSFGSASQTTKGALIGGVAGAATGYAVTGLGIIPGTVIGTILGASYGAYIDANSTMYDQLENSGVSIVTLGDQVMIVVPSARIFYPMKPEIKPGAYKTLNLLSRYINQYTKTLVKISVYTDNNISKNIDFALSQQQAESLARYMQATGVNSRLLYAAGYGGTRLVQRSAFAWDGNDNYRVEITFEKLPVCGV